jgi:hypothetical protein
MATEPTNDEQVFSHILEQVGKPGWKPEDISFLIDHPEFEHRPVGIEEFITSPEYMNAKDECWPEVLRDLKILFNQDVTSPRLSSYKEAVLEMGIGSGKSYRVAYMFAYAVYRLLCYKNPQSQFADMASGSTIAIMNMSLSAAQAKKVVFGETKRVIENSPWFQKFGQPDPQVHSELRFPKAIVIFPGSSSETAPLGYNIFFANMDEASFYTETDTHDVATEVYDAMDRRITSRFGDCGFLAITSSPRYVDDFTEKKINESRVNASIYARICPTWENKPADIEAVAIGKVFELAHPREKDAKGGARLVKIPLKYESAFKRNAAKAWRDFGAVASLVLEPYFTEEELGRIAKSMSNQLTPMVTHGRWCEPRPPVPGSIYFAHIDLAVRRDACGVAVCHREGSKVIVDLVLRIVCEQRAQALLDKGETFDLIVGKTQINFEEVRDIIRMLSSWGYPVKRISYDGFQSVDSRQILEAEGYETELISVDRNTSAYDTLKSLINTDRLVCVKHEHFAHECSRLELKDGKKIDHPPLGSKDCADAVAGAVQNLSLEGDVVEEQEETVHMPDEDYRIEVTEQI